MGFLPALAAPAAAAAAPAAAGALAAAAPIAAGAAGAVAPAIAAGTAAGALGAGAAAALPAAAAAAAPAITASSVPALTGALGAAEGLAATKAAMLAANVAPSTLGSGLGGLAAKMAGAAAPSTLTGASTLASKAAMLGISPQSLAAGTLSKAAPAAQGVMNAAQAAGVSPQAALKAAETHALTPAMNTTGQQLTQLEQQIIAQKNAAMPQASAAPRTSGLDSSRLRQMGQAMQRAGGGGGGGQPMQAPQIKRGEQRNRGVGSLGGGMFEPPQPTAAPTVAQPVPMQQQLPMAPAMQPAPMSNVQMPAGGLMNVQQPMMQPQQNPIIVPVQIGTGNEPQQRPLFAKGGYVRGPGTGTSDSIPATIYQDGKPVERAALSDGEFVMTERAVKNAGNGDRALGAARMYRMMRQLEKGGLV